MKNGNPMRGAPHLNEEDNPPNVEIRLFFTYKESTHNGKEQKIALPLECDSLVTDVLDKEFNTEEKINLVVNVYPSVKNNANSVPIKLYKFFNSFGRLIYLICLIMLNAL